jgi:hypothetical protein
MGNNKVAGFVIDFVSGVFVLDGKVVMLDEPLALLAREARADNGPKFIKAEKVRIRPGAGLRSAGGLENRFGLWVLIYRRRLQFATTRPSEDAQ